MKFAQPYLLNLLWLLIPIVGIMGYGIFKRKRILAQFASAPMLEKIIFGGDPGKTRMKLLLLILGAGFSIVALCGPQAGYRWEKVEQKGVDIMIALDCSKSMLAKDILPSRLDRAKHEIIDLLRMLRSDRAGLVAFSGKAILQCPLTLDHEAFGIFLKVLEPGYLPIGGTSLPEAVQTCYQGFEKDADTQKAIILITDGENTTGDLDSAAEQMAKPGIKVFCIGVGNLQGAPIPDEKGGFVKDSQGNIVLSKVNEDALKKLAAATGGVYVRSVAGDMDLDMIYQDNIRGRMEKKTLVSGKKKVWENRFQWFLFPAVLLFFMEMMLSTQKTNKRLLPIILMGILFSWTLQETAVAKMAATSVKEGIKAFENEEFESAKHHFIDAQLKDPDKSEIYYNIGAAAYMNKEYEQALKNFKRAAESTEEKLKHDAQYNLGNTYFRLGKTDEAIKTYEDILSRFPEDRQTKENLEFVRQQEQQQKQQQKNNSNEQKKDQQGQEKENSDKKNQDQEQENTDQNLEDQDTGQQPSKKDQSGDNGGENKKDKPRPEAQQQENRPDERNTAGMGQKKGGRPDKPGNVEHMLNRLEDKPGRAMMPAMGKQHVERDW